MTSFLDVLSHRIEAFTQLKVWPFYGIPSSECYQVKIHKIENEPCCERTGLRGSRPGPTQTGLNSH